MSTVITGRARLLRAAKDLSQRWREVQEVWHDGQCVQFEKRVMAPLEADIRIAAQAMERLESLLAQAQSDARSSEYR
jgi:hypothetical protein